jgi:hypothetical protein
MRKRKQKEKLGREEKLPEKNKGLNTPLVPKF